METHTRIVKGLHDIPLEIDFVKGMPEDLEISLDVNSEVARVFLTAPKVRELIGHLQECLTGMTE